MKPGRKPPPTIPYRSGSRRLVSRRRSSGSPGASGAGRSQRVVEVDRCRPVSDADDRRAPSARARGRRARPTRGAADRRAARAAMSTRPMPRLCAAFACVSGDVGPLLVAAAPDLHRTAERVRVGHRERALGAVDLDVPRRATPARRSSSRSVATGPDVGSSITLATWVGHLDVHDRRRERLARDLAPRMRDARRAGDRAAPGRAAARAPSGSTGAMSKSGPAPRW